MLAISHNEILPFAIFHTIQMLIHLLQVSNKNSKNTVNQSCLSKILTTSIKLIIFIVVTLL